MHFLHVGISESGQVLNPVRGVTVTVAVQLPLDGANQSLTNPIGLRVSHCCSDVNNAQSFQHGSEVTHEFSAIIAGDVRRHTIPA